MADPAASKLDEAATGPSDEGCRLFLPRASLAGCMFGAVAGDTRGLKLKTSERVNYFPATPYCSISLFFDGRSFLTEDWSAAGVRVAALRPLPPIIFSGPHRRPTVSLNPGPVHAITIAFFPDAIAALTGIDMTAYVDRTVPAGDALPHQVMALCRAALDCGDAEAAFLLLQKNMEPMWRAARPPGSAAAHMIADWTHHLMLRAATSRTGRSVRQVERRMRAWTGQSRRELTALSRTEQAFASAMSRLADEREDWAGLAVSAGYSDQSHLVREVRRLTGFPPNELRRRIKTERAFWCYRLLGAYY